MPLLFNLCNLLNLLIRAMAKKDWEEMHNLKFNYGEFATITDEPFFPSETFKNPFLGTTKNFSATQFNKPKLGNWMPPIPILSLRSLSQ